MANEFDITIRARVSTRYTREELERRLVAALQDPEETKITPDQTGSEDFEVVDYYETSAEEARD